MVLRLATPTFSDTRKCLRNVCLLNLLLTDTHNRNYSDWIGREF